MAAGAALGLSALRGLAEGDAERVSGTVRGVPFRAQVAIPDHTGRVRRRYAAQIGACRVPIEYRQFGVAIAFERPVELRVHNEDRVLDDGLREIVARFGPLMLRNAVLPDGDRRGGQRNIFPSLRFHFDRGATQADRFSLFWRDPFDAAQREPRTSSTLIVANAVAQLQALKEGDTTPELKPLYQLFAEEDVRPSIGDVVIEQPWDAPAGTGEITILDNRTVLHASYYPRPEDRGYPIGVRYLF